MPIFNGTDIKVTYFDYDVYAREKNILLFEKKTSNIDHVTVNDVDYFFYQSIIKIDWSDIIRSSIGVEREINISAGVFDSLTISYKPIDGFKPTHFFLPPQRLLLNMDEDITILFYPEKNGIFRLYGSQSGYSFVKGEFAGRPASNVSDMIISYTSTNFIHYIKLVKDWCGEVIKVRWLADCGRYKEWNFAVESRNVGSDKSISLLNDFDGYDIFRNKFIDLNLLLPLADANTFNYVADLISSNDVQIQGRKVFVQNSEINTIPEGTFFKPKDLRLTVREFNYEL